MTASMFCRPVQWFLGIGCAALIVANARQAVMAQEAPGTVQFNQRLQTRRTTEVIGKVIDDTSGAVLPARVYIQRDNGRWYFPEPTTPEGTAVRYERRNWLNTNSVEFHTTLSAHPFRIELEPGRYTIMVEHGKEYRALVQHLDLGAEPSMLPLPILLPLHRWVNMAARGWYSGDTHVHRAAAELPNIMQAEDLNVAFPLTYWVTKGFAPPTQGDKNTDAACG